MGHDLAGDEEGDAGGVDGDDLGADQAVALIERSVAVIAEEGLARRHLPRLAERRKADLGNETRLARLAVILLRHVAERIDQTVEIVPPVADADDDQHIERIGHLDLDVVLVVENLRGLIAGEAEIPDGDRQLGDVKIAHRREEGIFHHRFVEAGDARNPIDLASRLGGELDRLVEQFLSLRRHLHPRQIQRRHQNVRGAGALNEAEHLCQRRHVDPRPLRMEHRRLRHPADDLVGALDDQIGPRLDPGDRKVGMEFQMRAVRLVDHDHQPF